VAKTRSVKRMARLLERNGRARKLVEARGPHSAQEGAKMKHRFIARAIASGRIWLTLAAVACDGGADVADMRADDATVIVGQRDAGFEDSSRADDDDGGGGADDDSGGDTDFEAGAPHEAGIPGLDASEPAAEGGEQALDAGDMDAGDIDAHEEGSLDAAPPPPDGALASEEAAAAMPDDGAAQGPQDAALTPDGDAPSCTPNCAGRACGDNGCGGSCGTCTSGTCSAQGSCVCTPNCAGRACGDNGCGGSCGPCTSGQSCGATGQCTWPARSFAADVYPIFLAAGCPDCHDASSPSAGLNLSSASAAHANLVGQAGGECAPPRALVAPLSPETSYLINKLTGVGMCSGLRMPRGRTPLTDGEIDLVRAWIGSGAAP
jgi:hypothetical protein